MIYHINYFGLLADRRGIAVERIESTDADPAAVYRKLDDLHRLGLAISDMRVAVNDVFVAWDHLLNDGDSIAFLPPMSGG